MSETEKFTLEIIAEHLKVCEKRFLEIKCPSDFVNSDRGCLLLDALVTRLQAVAENLKRLLKQNSNVKSKYPDIEWDKIIRFRDLISHHYEKLDYEVIFDICEIDLPRLKLVINAELNS